MVECKYSAGTLTSTIKISKNSLYHILTIYRVYYEVVGGDILTVIQLYAIPRAMVPGLAVYFSLYTEYIIGTFVVTKEAPTKVQVCWFVPPYFDIDDDRNFGFEFIKGKELNYLVDTKCTSI